MSTLAQRAGLFVVAEVEQPLRSDHSHLAFRHPGGFGRARRRSMAAGLSTCARGRQHGWAIVVLRLEGARAAAVGHGETEVFVRPSPATAAEQLADTFLTGQFGLALLIASVLYYWRFHAGSLVFGASTFHYVQAFSQGFAADLPKILADHLPFK
jgi:hypothetical protein